MSYGATQEEWDAFTALAPNDILPIVCDPRIPPSDNSKVTLPSKTPTIINRSGNYAGLVGWTTRKFSQAEREDWRAEPAYGIGLAGRSIRAIDIDIDDDEIASAVAMEIEAFLGMKLPARRRKGQSRRLMLFKFSDVTTSVKKHVIHTPGGAIEFLFDRQFFVVAGVHKSGARHYWEDGLPAEVPSMTKETWIALVVHLTEKFAADSGEVSLVEETETQLLARSMKQVDTDSSEYQAVLNSKYFREVLPDGKVAVYCPWQHLHASTDGAVDENVTSTVYFPPSLGGRSKSGFTCMHASHGQKTVEQFLDKIGYIPDEFLEMDTSAVSTAVAPMLQGKSKSGFPCTTTNIHTALMAEEWMGVGIRMDEFTGTVVIRWDDEGMKWRPFRDADYPRLAIRLAKAANIHNAGREKLRDAVCLMSDINRIDTAKDWLNSLEWDGVPRIATMAEDILGCRPSAYTTAVSKYIWTALAGRVLNPGVKADMVPVLIGKQGARKSTFVHALCPKGKDWHVDLALDVKDSDTHRLVKGKVIAEIPELRGLQSREEEHIKAWLTKVEDSWIPKYQENSVTVARRFILIGTNNHARFLSDSTGNRRWLPMRVCETFGTIKTEKLTENLLQMWAEAKSVYQQHGILWREAEELASPILRNHMVVDVWHDMIVAFIKQEEELQGAENVHLTVSSVATKMGLSVTQMNAGTKRRIENVLASYGMEQPEGETYWQFYSLA